MTGANSASEMDDQSLCRHFGLCGGCATQDQPLAQSHEAKRRHVQEALTHQGIVCDVPPVIDAHGAGRRRATFNLRRGDGAPVVGFSQRAAHAIVNLEECRVLEPRLWAKVEAIRSIGALFLRKAQSIRALATLTLGGVDLDIAGYPGGAKALNADMRAQIAQRAADLDFARVSMGGEPIAALRPPQLRIGNALVAIPPGAFLQPTALGEQILGEFAVSAVDGAKSVADLFSGCGPFALRIAERSAVHAVEYAAPMLEALAQAARHASGLKPVTIARRDLHINPLGPKELDAHQAVVLDPPRAGAREQARALAQSRVKTVAFIACDAESFARDAAILIAGGYRLEQVQALDQFRWSHHIEVMATFRR
jgi:23S rRNA (uracil1939-C5)-methyltransferase